MIFFQDSRIAGIHANWVGNKFRDEGVSLREEPLIFGGMYSPEEKLHIDHLILTAVARPFSKYETVFQFGDINGSLELNDSYKALDRFFHGADSLKYTAGNLTALLYRLTEHPKVPSGILLAVHLKDVQFEGQEMEAIALLKLSTKMEGLDFRGKGDRYDIWPSGKIFSVENVELSAIIVNIDRENGYRVLVQYPPKSFEGYIWRDEFLQLKTVNDNFQKTSNFMKVYKNFVMEKLEESHEMDAMDQYELRTGPSAMFRKTKRWISKNSGTRLSRIPKSPLFSMVTWTRSRKTGKWKSLIGSLSRILRSRKRKLHIRR